VRTRALKTAEECSRISAVAPNVDKYISASMISQNRGGVAGDFRPAIPQVQGPKGIFGAESGETLSKTSSSE